MQIGILGSGIVGRTLGAALVRQGHDVAIGSRTYDTPNGRHWGTGTHGAVRIESYADAIRGAELVVNATPGLVSLGVVRELAPEDLDGVVLLDVANTLDFSAGMPPSVSGTAGDSLAEQIQRALPRARVVKALNTMTAAVMVDPGLLEGHHTVFVSGDAADAKALVTGLLTGFGWPAEDILDLGALDTARATEALMPLWLRIWGAIGTPVFNIAVVRSVPATGAVSKSKGRT
ncbi:NADPH-dependent F420 reductase [Arthrobacter antioxidans]|uniref:NADPH-dependent F420 reductase n=1 Tax=Arthrobacter antioxidans TaxID=2895818 RepID=UPI001FFF14DD|nr:NAD(P)-binding domain-containing protein [Arthrobacter antioxidans]